MATITLDQAKSIASEAANKYFASGNYFNTGSNSTLKMILDAYNSAGNTVEQSLKLTVMDFLYHAAIENPATFPGHTVTVGVTNPSSFFATLPSAMVVNFLYPEGSVGDRSAMVSALDSGQISKQDFTFGYLKIDPTSTHPSLSDVLKSATTPGIADSYPDSGLHVPGVTLSQQDFLVALYDSSFNRAPEFGGLKYWANKLAVELGYGTDQTTAYAVISKQMYIDGVGNKEAGTNLSNVAYVDYAYQNILGRNGDAAGVQYWNEKLASGAVDRGSFVAKFVGDALGNAGDGDFLQARIAVSKFAAQEHVSGPSAPPGIDLHAVIQNVYDAASAKSAINSIIQKYGSAPHNVSMELTAMLSAWADPANADATHNDAGVATIELSGVSGLQTHETGLAA